MIAWEVRPVAAGLGLLVTILVLAIGFRQGLRRWRVAQQSMSADTREWLLTHVPLYGTLSDTARTRFERDVCFVLDEYTFEGVEGVQVTDDLRRSVAAGIAVLLHGRPSWECPGSTTVLFYPGRFNEGYVESRDASFDGMAHQQGPIILSAPAVRSSWSGTDRADNVVLHELAHLFDFDNEGADGVPSFVASGSTRDWQALIRREMGRVQRGQSLLRPYAAESPSEFFAVAVETFFEQPEEMADSHPTLFRALRAFFHVDPRTGESNGALTDVAPAAGSVGD